MSEQNNQAPQGQFIIPALPLRDVVVFPNMIFPLFIGRKKSIEALQIAYKSSKHVFLISQKKPSSNNISAKELHEVGVLGYIVQMLKLPDGTLKILVDAKKRARMLDFYTQSAFSAHIQTVEEIYNENDKSLALIQAIKEKYRDYAKLENRLPDELANAIYEINHAGKLSDHVVSSLTISISQKQKVLSQLNVNKRLESALALLQKEYQVLDTKYKIDSNIKTQVASSQREYYLNEQLKAIKKELGDDNTETSDADEFDKLIKTKKLTKEAKTKAISELKKLKQMNPMSSEAGITRSYLEWLLTIPWNEPDEVNIDLDQAQKILNEGHYGLEKVKERIIEFIAVNRRVQKLKGPILCLVGPPGVGKTSLAKSIAKTMGRKFSKLSLGGMRDEAEIRGHRRTYIGALPGKIIQNLKKNNSSNPLILLDEIDKIGKDFRGDPASALLEVLDPEQNNKFNDHYLEVDYDLSEIMFVTTANTLDIPHALRDRLEIIRLSGYTEDEKLNICKKYLVPKQMEGSGLKEQEFSISDAAILDLIRGYTYEAGVRNLEREIANLVRKSVKKIDSEKNTSKVTISVSNVEKYAGVKKFDHGIIEENNLIGITTGLAYTEFGGDILSIESVKIPGTGKITFTGKLGDVMKESIQAAHNLFKAKSHDFGISQEEYSKFDIHIHVPEGATPKDGPSAGCAICTSIISLMTDIPVDRFVAMTGEITLRGRVLPIGGLKEKLLAAIRAGVKRVIIPEKNAKDLKELPAIVKDSLEIILANDISTVLKAALVEEIKTLPPLKAKPPSEKSTAISTH